MKQQSSSNLFFRIWLWKSCQEQLWTSQKKNNSNYGKNHLLSTDKIITVARRGSYSRLATPIQLLNALDT